MSLSASVGRDFEQFSLDAQLTELRGVTALVGPNGAGKSTLLRSIAGLASARSVLLGGEEVAALPAHKRRIGLLPAEPLLRPTASAGAEVALTASARGRRGQRDVARDVMEALGCADLGHRRCRDLSSGEAARVSLARALAAAPRALLLDEPLSRLDAEARPTVRAALRQALASYSPPVLLVTHDIVDAAALAARVIVLEAGRVVQDGSLHELTTRPRSAWSARFAGLELLRGRAVGGEIALDEGGELRIAGTASGPVLVALRASSVALSTERPSGSARNAWQVTVRGLESLGDRVRVDLDGPPSVAADVTPTAVAELGLAPGARLWASVKATDLDAYPS